MMTSQPGEKSEELKNYLRNLRLIVCAKDDLLKMLKQRQAANREAAEIKKKLKNLCAPIESMVMNIAKLEQENSVLIRKIEKSEIDKYIQ